MRLQESLQKLYLILSKDDILTRLLHYVPKNAQDDPLSENKLSIIDLPVKEKQNILNTVLISTDKIYDLDYKNVRISRLCFYTGIRKPLDFQSNLSGRSVNPYVSEQTYLFDVYVHVDIDSVDQRLTQIVDRLGQIFQLELVNDIGEFILDYITPINSTPDGFIGLRSAYKLVSVQESRDNH